MYLLATSIAVSLDPKLVLRSVSTAEMYKQGRYKHGTVTIYAAAALLPQYSAATNKEVGSKLSHACLQTIAAAMVPI